MASKWAATFFEHAGENTAATAAYSAAAVLSVEGWQHLPTAAAAAGYCILGAVASRHLGPGKRNDTASFNPRIVAAKRDKQ